MKNLERKRWTGKQPHVKQRIKIEDEVPGNGWCGYVAMNQIINNDDYASKMDDETEISKLRDSVDQIYKMGHGGMMSGWKKKAHPSSRQGRSCYR